MFKVCSKWMGFLLVGAVYFCNENRSAELLYLAVFSLLERSTLSGINAFWIKFRTELFSENYLYSGWHPGESGTGQWHCYTRAAHTSQDHSSEICLNVFNNIRLPFPAGRAFWEPPNFIMVFLMFSHCRFNSLIYRLFFFCHQLKVVDFFLLNF